MLVIVIIFALQVSNSLHHFIWWWLSVEYNLVQNIKYIFNCFRSNYFEFTSEETWSWLISSSSSSDSSSVSSQSVKFSKQQTYQTFGINLEFSNSDVKNQDIICFNILSFISFILFCFGDSIGEYQWLWSDDCSDFLLFIALLNTPSTSFLTGLTILSSKLLFLNNVKETLEIKFILIISIDSIFIFVIN